MTTWFEGSNEIDCDLQQVLHALENYAELFTGLTRLMPGLTSVELVEQGEDSVTIKTNEGLMKRKNISKRIEADGVILEFDEEYQAGQMATFKTHYLQEYTQGSAGVRLRVVLSDVEAPGIMGFFYRTFGKTNIGNAVLASNKSFFEANSS